MKRLWVGIAAALVGCVTNVIEPAPDGARLVTSSSTASSGSASGGGGAGGGGVGPSAPADGAYQVHFVGGAGCNVQSHIGALGAVSLSTHDAVVTDGIGGALVSCSVTNTGPFNVSADIIQGADSLSIRVPSISASATKDNPAKGGVSYTSAIAVGTISVTSSDAYACDFYFMAPESISPGMVWIAFTCTRLTDSIVGSCQAYESYVLVENCLYGAAG